MRTLESKDFRSSETYEDKVNFTREDLDIFSESVSLDYSVYTDKGSEENNKDVSRGESSKDSAAGSNSKSHSPFWKRIDMRQKKVIRGLCGLTKDYFKNMIPETKTKKEMFAVWDEFLQQHFPELYQTSRLMLLGHISVMCLSWKFSDKINDCELYTKEEKSEIIQYGTQFRDQRNGCSSSKVRKAMLDSPIVKIGKLLYISSPKMEESFWCQINERKKAEIVNLKIFKDAHIKDINKIPVINFLGDL